jgi:hypothetical protein
MDDDQRDAGDRRQWHCPPLRAWISLGQCVANRRRVRGAGPDDEHARIWLRECAECRGVEWWADNTGQRPREIALQLLRTPATPATVAERCARFDRPVARRARGRFD